MVMWDRAGAGVGFCCKKLVVQVKPPNLELIDSEWNRIRKAVAAKLIIDEKEVCTEISFLDTIYKHLNRNNYNLKCILFNNEIIDVFDRNEKIYVAAVDIGTTSIVCYLWMMNCRESGVCKHFESTVTVWGRCDTKIESCS